MQHLHFIFPIIYSVYFDAIENISYVQTSIHKLLSLRLLSSLCQRCSPLSYCLQSRHTQYRSFGFPLILMKVCITYITIINFNIELFVLLYYAWLTWY